MNSFGFCVSCFFFAFIYSYSIFSVHMCQHTVMYVRFYFSLRCVFMGCSFALIIMFIHCNFVIHALNFCVDRL